MNSFFSHFSLGTDRYRYVLASNKIPKANCPHCGARKHWQRYMDVVTGEALPPKYGRCDNAVKCGEGLNPYSDGYHREGKDDTLYRHPHLPTYSNKVRSEKAYIPHEVLQDTLSEYEENVFLQNLIKGIPYPFAMEDVQKVIEQYYLGTVAEGYRQGGLTIPYIDHNGEVHAIQVKKFDEANHTTHTDWLHSVLKKRSLNRKESIPSWLTAYENNTTKVGCCFGAHLLAKYRHNPIALVEAPKTAIYGTLYFGFPEAPDNFLWLAVYNLSSLTLAKCRALQGRDVYLFPDLSRDGHAYRLWKDKAEQFNRQLPNTRFQVVDFLEEHATDTEKESGLDLADFLIKQDWLSFRTETVSQSEKVQVHDKPLELPVRSATRCEKDEKCEDSEKPFFPETLSVENPVLDELVNRLGLELIGESNSWIEPHPYYDGKDPYWPTVRWIEKEQEA